ncbi:hypothetical protein FDECE_16930 [Fusarium decemcellulare]|nr:hypothetical protein FDECE_16930 [Fusarium decemcellulare]
MTLQDAIFQDSMTFAQWDLTIRSKVQTSQNLHELLPKDLDFLTCHLWLVLSMRNIGIIAESGAYQRQRQTSNDMQPIDDNELLALLTVCCDPDGPPPVPPMAQGQVLFGLRTPADILMQGQSPPTLLKWPLLATFSYLVNAENTSDREANHLQDAKALFHRMKDSGERALIVLRALASKLARAMSISADDVEPSKLLSTYGVDSLMAVELRNWTNKEFSTTVAVFDIMGGVPIARIAELVVMRGSG